MALAISRSSLAHHRAFLASPVSVSRRLLVCVRGAADEKVPVIGKAALVEKIAKGAAITKTQAALAYESLFEAVEDAVTAGQKVTVLGFGTFESRSRKEKAGRNPRTGEAITIPATKAPAFRASASFKEKVNGKAAPLKAKPAAPSPAAPTPAAPVKAAAPRPAVRPVAPTPAPAVKKTVPLPSKRK